MFVFIGRTNAQSAEKPSLILSSKEAMVSSVIFLSNGRAQRQPECGAEATALSGFRGWGRQFLDDRIIRKCN